MEWLESFIAEGYAIVTTLGINIGTLFIFFFSWLKTKVQTMDKNAFFKELQAAKDEVEIKLRKEYEAKFDDYQKQIVDYLKSLENKVIGKIDSNEAERKEELAKQTLELEATIEATKKNTKANIDEILNS